MASQKVPLDDVLELPSAPRAVHENGVLNDFEPVDRDTAVLARSGKKQVLKRRFGILGMCGIALTNMFTWEGAVGSLGIGLRNGGPAGLLYGLILSWIGSTSVYLCLGELASMMPTAGGQFHWLNALASGRSKVPLSYIAGWITTLTWVAATTGNGYGVGANIMQIVGGLDPSFEPKPYYGAVIMVATLVLAILVNTVFARLLPAFEVSFLILHIVAYLAIIIPVANLGTPGSAVELFTRFENTGHWSSNGLAFLVGLQGMAGTFTGGDSAVHMAEEVENAEVNVARSMMISVYLNGALAFTLVFVLLYFGGPIDVLVESPVQYPWLLIVETATKSKTAMGVTGFVHVFMGIAGTCGTLAAGSRMVWSFARDRGLPFSRFLQKIDKRRAIPVYAVFAVVTPACAFGFIQIGSSVVFEIFISLILIGFVSSYLVVLVALLYRRLRGDIKEPEEDGQPSPDAPLQWGKWRLKGWLGTANNIFGIAFLLVVGFFNFWPPHVMVTAKSMNWSSVIFCAIMILSAIYYLFRAKNTYHGPIFELGKVQRRAS